eukprot:COSAG02_NODE_3354_length_6883_cov_188.063237_2_plen_127_part_00
MGQLQDYTVDQLAGAIALSLGALGSLLLVIWQSTCSLRCRLGISDQCYLFDCSREPPPVDPEKPEESNGESLVPPKTSDPKKKPRVRFTIFALRFGGIRLYVELQKCSVWEIECESRGSRMSEGSI